MVEDAAYFLHQQQQQQQRLNSSFSLDDEFDLFDPHFSSEPDSNSSPSYPLPFISPETMPCFAARSVETPQSFSERSQKQLKTESWNHPRATEHMTCDVVISPSPSESPDSQLISFANPDSSPAISNPFYGKILEEAEACIGYQHTSENLLSLNILNNVYLPLVRVKGTYEIPDRKDPQMKSTSATSRTPVHSQDHLLAERKRRERLSERFIALSAIIPNLKKMDRASILEDAIKYLKELQQSVKKLEEEVAAKTVESAVMVKRSQLTTDEDTNSSPDKNSCSQSDQQLSLPEIEARVSGKCVLIKIHCEKRNGFIPKMIGEIEKMNLTVVNSCVLPFGTSILDVTIQAQMDVKFSMKMADLVRNLRRALPDFM
ncbi:hypothetical protein BT93_J1687 [Corymbia citriodora subsp. variegata]|nr:hypothetical protein BT93_J1687 [Corymbia citriodora subsp. variegata]